MTIRNLFKLFLPQPNEKEITPEEIKQNLKRMEARLKIRRKKNERKNDPRR